MLKYGTKHGVFCADSTKVNEFAKNNKCDFSNFANCAQQVQILYLNQWWGTVIQNLFSFFFFFTRHYSVPKSTQFH